MNPKFLLRIAAVLMFLHAVGHTIGSNSGEAPNDAIAQVVREMEANHFNFMGRSLTLASIDKGYSVGATLQLLLVSLLLWFMSIETESRLFARIAPLLAVYLLLNSVVEYIYFFPLAAMITFLAGVCTLLSRLIKKTKPILS